MRLNLKPNEIAIGDRTIFQVPADCKIRVTDVKQALINSKFTIGDIDHFFHPMPSLIPYCWSMVNLLKRYNEISLYGKPYDEVLLLQLTELFRISFGCKLLNRKTEKDLQGREVIKITIVKEMF